jgi:hypothetical protein
MPDGELSPEQQINTEVTVDQSLHALGAAFGANTEAKLGGTPNGSWTFTDLNELGQVIQQWDNIGRVLTDRAHKIEKAASTVLPPAKDIMSGVQADAFQRSLQVLAQHAMDMAAYAFAYSDKLKDARSGYSVNEHDIATRLDGTHG